MFASTVIGPVAYSPAMVKPSPPAQVKAGEGDALVQNASAPAPADEQAARGQVAETEGAATTNSETLTEQDLRQLAQLKTTDREVHQHELAHQVAGGAYSGSASFEYVMGPDGQRYAVAGSVPIDYGPVGGDPRATIDKMQQVIAAALAPADPSPKDHQVAATARQYLLTAQLELAQQLSEMNAARANATSNTEPTQAATLGERVSLNA